MNLLPTIVGPVSDGARLGDARAARPLGPVIDLDPVNGYAAGESPAQAIRAYGRQGERQHGGARQFPRTVEVQPAISTGFIAQQIAQEVLSEGLYFENYRPALAAYAAADSNFALVRKPPPSMHVVWA